MLQPHPPLHTAPGSPRALLAPTAPPFAKLRMGGPCQCCMPRTQPASRGSSPSSQTHRPGWQSDRERGRVARAVSRVTCPLEHAELRVVGLTDGPGWPGEKAGPGLARSRSTSLLVTFLPFFHNEMELGKSRQAEEAGRRSFSYPSSSAMLGQILILPAVLQLLPKRGILALREWFGAPCRHGAPGLCTSLLGLSQQSSPNCVA